MKLLDGITPTKQEFDEVIYKILQNPEYKHLKNGFRDLIERLKEAFGEWLFKLLSRRFSNLKTPKAISNNLSTAFIILGILILLGIIIIIVVKSNRIIDKKKRVKEILGEKIDNKTTPQSLKNKALQLSGEGDFRGACRYDFIALLLLMHEKNLLYLDETKTNREIYNILRKNGFSFINVFKELSDMFNSSWYGHKICNNDMYTKWNDSMALVWNGVMDFEEKS